MRFPFPPPQKGKKEKTPLIRNSLSSWAKKKEEEVLPIQFSSLAHIGFPNYTILVLVPQEEEEVHQGAGVHGPAGGACGAAAATTTTAAAAARTQRGES